MKNKEKMFEVETDSDTLSNSIRAITSLLSEATLIFDKDGLKIKETNGSNSACVNFVMKKENFKKYQIPAEITKIRVNLKEFKAFYDRCRSGYSHKARFNTDGESLIISQIESDKRITKQFNLPIYNEENTDKNADVDKIEQALEKKIDIEMPISKKDFTSALKDLELVVSNGGAWSNGDNIHLIAQKEFLIVKDNNSRAKTIIERYNTNPTKDLRVLGLKEFKVKSQFGFGAIQGIMDIGRTDFTDKFTFRLGNNNPLQIMFEEMDKSTTLKMTLANIVSAEIG